MRTAIQKVKVKRPLGQSTRGRSGVIFHSKKGHFVQSSPTYDEEDDKANDEEGGATDGHSASKVDEGRKQQGGPKHEVQQRPWPATWDYCGSGVLAFLFVVFL